MRNKLILAVVSICAVIFAIMLFRYLQSQNDDTIEAFKTINKKMETSNASINDRIDSLKIIVDGLKNEPLKEKILKVDSISSDLYTSIQDLKNNLQHNMVDAKIEASLIFRNNKQLGKRLKKDIETYRDSIAVIVMEKDSMMAKSIRNNFSTDIPADQMGMHHDWIDYQFKSIPVIATLTKLTQYQVDIESAKFDIYRILIEKEK